MTTARVLDALHAIVRRPDECSDGEHLRRFLVQRDEAAFAELVRRHGPMVFGACRRVLGGTADADDAFQATFFVLACRAGDVRGGQLGAWLYGVAVRVAWKARRQAVRRRVRDMAAARPEAVHPITPEADLWAVLDDELAKLPADLRAAVLACDVVGQSRAQAARDLGWPEGTVAKRLAKGREQLARRLTRRGISLSVPALAAALAEGATAGVPGPLLAEAARQGAAFAVGGAGSPAVRSLAEGVMRSLKVGMFQVGLFVGLVAATLAGGLMLAGGPPAGDKPEDPKAESPAPVPRPPAPEWRAKTPLEFPGRLPVSVAHSADGKVTVVGDTEGKVTAFVAATQKKLWESAVGGSHAAVAFAADGKTVFATCENGVRVLDAANGTRREPEIAPIQPGGSRPTAVVALPAPEKAKPGVAFGNAAHIYVSSWATDAATGGMVPGSFTGTLDLDIVMKGEAPVDAQAVPLAADPAGRYVLMTAKIADQNKNVLMGHPLPDRGVRSARLLVGHAARVVSAAWSADGTTIVSGDADGRVIVWDAATFKEKQRLELGNRVAALAVTADAKQIAAVVVGRQADFYAWEAARPTNTMRPIHTQAGDFAGAATFASLAFSPDGKRLAGCVGSRGWLNRLSELTGKVHVWETGTAPPGDKPPLQTAAPEPTATFAWAPDGRTVVTGGSDGQITGRDPATLKDGFGMVPGTRRVNPGPQLIHAVAYSPDGTLLVLSHRDGVLMRDTATMRDALFPRQKQPLTCEPGVHPYMVAFSTKGRLFAYGTVAGPVRVLDTWSGQVLQSFDTMSVAGEQPAALALAFSPDGTKLAFGVNAGHAGTAARVRVVDPRSGRSVGTVDGTDDVRVLAWSPDGKRLATGNRTTPTGALWDADTGKAVRDLDTRGGSVRGLAFLPDGKTLAVAESVPAPQPAGRVRFQDAATGREVAVLPLGSGEVPGLAAVSPDGATLGVAAVDAAGKGTMRLLPVTALDTPTALRWAVEKTIFTPPAPPAKLPWAAEPPITDPLFDIEALAVSPDGKRFAVSYGGRTDGYDVAARKKLYTVEGRAPRFVGDGLFTWDGRATESDAGTGKERKPFPAAKSVLTWKTVAFSPDGKTVAGFDGTDVHLRDVATGADGPRLTAPAAKPGDTRLARRPAADVAWSPDGKRVAGFRAVRTATDTLRGGPVVWGSPGGAAVADLDRLEFRPKGPWPPDFEPRNTVLAFSPDGTLVAAGASTPVRSALVLYDAGTAKPLRTVMIPSFSDRAGEPAPFELTAAAFAPDGATLAVGLRRPADKGPHSAVEIYPTGDAKPPADRITLPLAPDTPPVTALAYTPDGRTLIAVTGSGVADVPNKSEALHRILIWRKVPAN